jgi:hypothetical protein
MTRFWYTLKNFNHCFVLFCFVLVVPMRSTEPRCFKLHFWSLWNNLEEEGCINLVSSHLDLWCRSSWILNDFSLKIKLSHSWNFWKDWNFPLVLLERSSWTRFNGFYLVRFGFKMWEILILKWLLALKIQINSQKPGFGRKNQLRTW